MAYPDVPIWLELTRLGGDFALSAGRSILPNPALANIQRYCLFMGAPRNGHSLVGAMLDAHPEMLIAHELGLPKYKVAHFSKRQIELLILSNSKKSAANGRQHIHYSHSVPNQWQGRYKNLQLVGDKHGEGFLLSVEARPWLVDTLLKSLNPCHFIHVIRNPYDAIASILSTVKRQHTQDSAIAYFERLYQTLSTVSDKLAADQLHEIHFEQLVSQPQKELEKLCGFLGFDATTEYLQDCSSIVLDDLGDHRALVEWSPSSRQKIDKLINSYSFLSKYSFEQVGIEWKRRQIP